MADARFVAVAFNNGDEGEMRNAAIVRSSQGETYVFSSWHWLTENKGDSDAPKMTIDIGSEECKLVRTFEGARVVRVIDDSISPTKEQNLEIMLNHLSDENAMLRAKLGATNRKRAGKEKDC